jgi:predicted DNA binding protein
VGVVADLGVSGDDTILGALARSIPAVGIEVEPTIPVGELMLPLVWIYADDQRAVREAISERDVARVTDVVETHKNHVLYRIEWIASDDLVRCLIESDSLLLRASGDADRWQFRLQFRESGDFTAFQESITELDLDVRPTRIHHGTTDEDCLEHLSMEQIEVLKLAEQNGYFEVPRQCTLQTIADRLDISDQAASARMRRGLNHLLDDRFPTTD